MTQSTNINHVDDKHVEFLSHHLSEMELIGFHQYQYKAIATFLLILANGESDGESSCRLCVQHGWKTITTVYKRVAESKKFLTAMDFGQFSIKIYQSSGKVKLSDSVRAWVLKMQDLAEVLVA